MLIGSSACNISVLVLLIKLKIVRPYWYKQGKGYCLAAFLLFTFWEFTGHFIVNVQHFSPSLFLLWQLQCFFLILLKENIILYKWKQESYNMLIANTWYTPINLECVIYCQLHGKSKIAQIAHFINLTVIFLANLFSLQSENILMHIFVKTSIHDMTTDWIWIIQCESSALHCK